MAPSLRAAPSCSTSRALEARSLSPLLRIQGTMERMKGWMLKCYEGWRQEPFINYESAASAWLMNCEWFFGQSEWHQIELLARFPSPWYMVQKQCSPRVTPWIFPFSFSDDFLGLLDLICFSMAMWFWNLGRSCLPRFYSGLSSPSSSQNHVIFILDLIQYSFSWEYSFSIKGITL